MLCITKNTTILLYGYNVNSEQAYNQLLGNGYKSVYLLDRNAAHIRTEQNIDIYTADEIIEKVDVDNTVSIICLRDFRKHKMVAEFLYETGFRYIVFLPNDMNMDVEIDAMLRRVYSCYYIADLENCVVLEYQDCFMDRYDDANTIILERENEVWVRCPRELVYWITRERVTQDEQKAGCSNRWEDVDIPIMEQASFVQLMKFLNHDKGLVELYTKEKLKRFEKREEKKDESSLIEERRNLFNVYCQHFSRGMSFFEASPGAAEWNNKGYFNLKDGHHRSTFLAYKGCRYIPIRISKEDYRKWKNESKLESLKKLLIDKEVLSYPIEHPCFVNWKVENEWQSETLLQWVMRHLYRRDISDLIVVDMTDSLGYYGRNFVRRGVKEIIVISRNNWEHDVINAISKLLYTEKMKVNSTEEAMSSNNGGRVLALLGKDFLNRVDFKDLINWLRNTNPEAMTLEFDKDSQLIKKICNELSFYSYMKIFDSFNHGKTEVGILYKKKC